MRRLCPALALAAASAASAPSAALADADASPLGSIRDDQQLAEAVAQIAHDPAVHVDDPRSRARAQELLTDAVRQLQAHAYERALASFLAAHGLVPSPKLLLDIAATLRALGRPADAANTYQLYLIDPTTGSERVGEVKQLLADLDRQLCVLTVRGFPRGSQVSIDAGPFVPVGSALFLRVRPGLHLVRVRLGDLSSELAINAFEGEAKDVPLALPEGAGAAAPPADAPDRTEGWLITGTQYTAGPGNQRGVVGVPAPAPAVSLVELEVKDSASEAPVVAEEHISSGAIGALRIDGHGRGVAGGAGILYASNDSFELEGSVLRSDFWGVYLGARYRLLTGMLRPYLAAGLPIFEFSANDMSTTIAPGVRGAAGLEVRLTTHLSVQGDLGYEHFWNVDGVVYKGQYRIDADVFVPTLGVIGRL